jgi:hypothetical protein
MQEAVHKYNVVNKPAGLPNKPVEKSISLWEPHVPVVQLD